MAWVNGVWQSDMIGGEERSDFAGAKQLTTTDFQTLAKAFGYTGPANGASAFLLGMRHKDGTPVTSVGEYQQLAYSNSPMQQLQGGYSALKNSLEGDYNDLFGQQLMADLQTSDPQIAQAQAAYNREIQGTDWTDTLGPLVPLLAMGALSAVAGPAIAGSYAGAAGGASGAGSLGTYGGVLEAGTGLPLGGYGMSTEALVAGGYGIPAGEAVSGGTMGDTSLMGADDVASGYGDFGASDYSFDGTGIDPGSGIGPTGMPTTGGTPFESVISGPPPNSGGFNPRDILGTGIGVRDLAGGILQAGVGAYGAGQQADAYENVANQNLALGAPYRDLLQQSYGQGFNLMDQPGYGDAFNRMADISTRQWSTRGNPANNPGIQGGILGDVWNQSYLPALSNYRGQLGQFGGLGLNTAGAAQLGGASNADAGTAAIAGGLGRIFGGATQPTLEDTLKKYGLTVGGVNYGGGR